MFQHWMFYLPSVTDSDEENTLEGLGLLPFNKCQGKIFSALQISPEKSWKFNMHAKLSFWELTEKGKPNNSGIYI